MAPLTLTMSAAIYAIVIPFSLTLYLAEALVVNPLKGVCNISLTNEHETFIEEVCQANELICSPSIR